MSSLRLLHRQAAQHFDERYKRKQSESFLSQQEHTIWVPRNRPLRIKYLHLDVSLWKQYKIQVAKFLFMYSFTYTNIVFLFKHLSAGIVMFKSVCNRRWSVSVMILFPFLGAGFANISPTFLISYKLQTRFSEILKYSERYIWDNLSGTKVRIWIRSEYDTVFNFSCIALCELTKALTFSCMSILSWESDAELFKQSTCTF